jgi:hypothetical protein
MANPNIVNVTTILGNTSSTLISSTANPFVGGPFGGGSLINNAASSGKVYKVNTIIAANVDGVNNAEITIKIFSEDDLGGTGTAIASTVTVPADASVVIIDKNSSFYLLEDKSIGVTASAANDIVVTCSWEEIS